MLRFVINLDRSPDRWLSINKQLTKLGINAERISAFDGNTLTHDEIKKLTPKLYSKWEFPREISSGEIGCYLSHLECWKKLVSSDDDWALVMEDDIQISERALKFLSDSSWIPEGVDIIQPFVVQPIMRYKVSKKFICIFDNDKCALYHPLKPHPLGTLAYFISKNAAIDAIAHSFKIAMPVDEFLFGAMSSWAKRHPTWKMNPAIVCDSTFSSTISSVKRNINMKNSTLNTLNPKRQSRKLLNSIRHIFFSKEITFKYEQYMHTMSKKNKLKNTVDEYFYNLINDVNKDVSIAHIGDYKFYPHLSTKNCIYINKHLNFARFRYFSSAYLGWGKNASTIKLAKEAKNRGVPIFLIEDGFIRSIFSWVANVDPSLRSGLSYVVDTKGFYFDSSRQTDLEDLLNNYQLNDSELNESKKLQSFIIDNKLSKYNYQPSCSISHLANSSCKKKVLVIDQSRGDQSISGGGVDDSIFEKKLSDAIRENKNSEILFKIHPDTLETKAAIKISKELLDQVTILSNPINPIALIQQIDVIYVATSQMGFEGLLCGKEVHTYGMPFYAGWGLTIDKMHCNRRLRKLTLDELFYITYIKYTHYINPFTGNEDSLENTLKYLVNLKKQLKIY